MNDDNIFTKIIVIGLVSAVLSMVSCNVVINYDDNIAMKDMVKNGADPIDASCAVKSITNSVCSIRAATKNNR